MLYTYLFAFFGYYPYFRRKLLLLKKERLLQEKDLLKIVYHTN